MTSEEDFPSLKHKIKSYKFKSDLQYNRKGKKIFIKTIGKQEWAGEIRLNNQVYFNDVKKYCLDKQQAKKIIEDTVVWFNEREPDNQERTPFMLFSELKDRLGL